jgi:hypothetical protein
LRIDRISRTKATNVPLPIRYQNAAGTGPSSGVEAAVAGEGVGVVVAAGTAVAVAVAAAVGVG